MPGTTWEANEPNLAPDDVKIPLSQDQPACFMTFTIPTLSDFWNNPII